MKENVLKAKSEMGKIFNAQKELRNLFPDFSWKGLGNTLGDYGELIAVEVYNMKKADKGSKGFDAEYEGKTVQIKTIMHSKQIGLRGTSQEAEMILVLLISEIDASWEECFFGSYQDFLSVGSSFSKRDNKRLISLSKLLNK